MEYRREIDGLRAVAVIPVILFHAGFEVFSGGFVGVDIFFVISGYLITSIILTDLYLVKFSLTRFYERRAKRILPALFLVMLVSAPFSYTFLYPSDFISYSKSVTAMSLFYSNFFFLETSHYFETASELKPFLHTWSLAVEEQFYLIFPIVMIYLYRLGNWILLLMLGVAFFTSLILSQLASFYAPTFNFYMLPTRGWELLIGAFLAIYSLTNDRHKKRTHIADQFFSLLGLLCIIYAVLSFDKQTPFPSFYALVPTVGTALVILFSSSKTLVFTLLSNSIAVRIGLISYGAYLWHQPIFSIYRHVSIDRPSTSVLLALIAITIGLASLSYYFYEQPIRIGKFKAVNVFIISIVGLGSFAAAGALSSNMKPNIELSKDEAELYSYSSYPKKLEMSNGRCFINASTQSYIDFAAECRSPDPQAPEVFLWGDSHAASLSIGLNLLHNNTAQFTAGSCPPLLGITFWGVKNCKQINLSVLTEIERTQPSNVILSAHWYSYGKQRRSSLKDTIIAIQEISPDSDIIVVGTLPLWPEPLWSYLLKRHLYLNKESSLELPMYLSLKKLDNEIELTANRSSVQFFSTLDIFCVDHKTCKTVIKYKDKFRLTTYDYGHLTEAGSALVALFLIEEMKLIGE